MVFSVNVMNIKFTYDGQFTVGTYLVGVPVQ